MGVTDDRRGNPDEEDIMERELAEDAVWKRIQKNTFTRWANEHLKTVNSHIENLETDFEDGTRLVALVEVLSGKRLPRHNKKPKLRAQKLENVNIALNFLTQQEGIKIVNIDSTDVVDGHLKLILGLIWTLILHYSISMPMWEGEDDSMYRGRGEPTPKQRLLGWIKNKIPEVPVNNFTTDWNSGKALGALVDAVAPGLCPDWPDWKPEDALKNTKEAMKLADDWLNVPQLIKPDDVVDPKVDDLSMMTYLSQYPNAKLKEGAPLRPRNNPNRVRCYGPGIQPDGVVKGAQTNFTVETFSAGKGKVEVFIADPTGKMEPVAAKFNDDPSKTYTCSYTPKVEGQHKVIVKFNGVEVPKSPFSVNVEGVAGDASKVTASGPGLQPTGVQVGKPTYFDVFTKGAGKGQLEVVILDPSGKPNTVPLRVRPIGDDVYRCEYVAQATGVHSVNVFFAGKQVPKSPFGVRVSPICDPRKVRASGRGLQPTGVRVGDVADFKVTTDGAGEGNLDIKVIGPDGKPEKVNIRKVDGTTFDCDYKPTKTGKYVVIVSFGNQEIFRSPFEVNVGPPKQSKIRAFGPGLKGGVVGYPAKFTVDTNGETGTLGFTIEGPSEAKIQCMDNGDGSAEVIYYPTAPGEYAIHVLNNGEDIPQSPWVAQITSKPGPDFAPDKVVTAGKGIGPTVVQGKPTDFTVDTRKAGKAPLDVSVIDKACEPLPMKIANAKDGTVKCEYKPENPDKHVVQVNYGGVAVPGSPFKVQVAPPTDAAKVKIFGPGVEPGVKPGVPTFFNIDAEAAGPGQLKVSLKDDKGKDVPIQLQDNENNTYSVDYTVPKAGIYTVNATYSGQPIPGCPITVPVTPAADLSKVKVEGLEPTVFVDSPTEFTVDTRALPKKSEATVTCKITNPSGAQTATAVTKAKDGTHKVAFTPFEEGPHKVDVMVDGQPVKGSPFAVNATRGCNPGKVKAYGPGLEQGIVNQKNTFTVETKGAGIGALGLSIEGPSEAKMNCRDNRDGTCTVDYVPIETGDYDIGIKFANKQIPGSPFRVPVDHPVDVSKVTAFGPGLDPANCRAGPPLPFTVDASKTGKAPLTVEVSSEKGPVPYSPEINDSGDGIYDVSYLPPPEGSKCNVNVKYGGQPIPGSPFQMKVKPMTEPQNVKLSGPGIAKTIPASFPAEFTIDAKNAGYGRPEVKIQAPDGSKCKASIIDNQDGTYKVNYTPDDVGNYKIGVTFGGKPVPGAPITVKTTATGQADKCKIAQKIKETVAAGEEQCLQVDARQAGKGAVTCKVNKVKEETRTEKQSTTTTKSQVKKVIKQTTTEEEEIEEEEEIIEYRVIDNKDGTYNVYYKAIEQGDYKVDLKFGGQPIPNGSFSIKTTSTTEEIKTRRTVIKKSESSYSEVREFRQIQLYNVPVPPSSVEPKRRAFIKMPSGATDKPTIIDNHDGTISVKYDPKEEGLHELHIIYNEDPIAGSPFKFFVDRLSSGAVTAAGPGLTHGIAGEPSDFTIYTKGAGNGGLQVAVEGPSKADIQYVDNSDSTVSVSYLPILPGEYKIVVKFAGRHIKGSPFTAKITGEGRKRAQLSVGHSSEVSLKCSEKDIRNLAATIVAPSGLEEPCFVKKLPNGHLGISFTPRECGEHCIHVKRMGKHISGSPFKINVLEREIGDASKVMVSGNALKEGHTHVDNEFVIDTKEAGFGGLSLSIEGPSKAEINCKDNEDGTLNVAYKPTEPGYYIINLKFADHHVPGSPFTVKVTGQGSNIQRENIKKQRDALPITDVGSECKLTFKMPGTAAMDMNATVTSPSGKTEDAEILDLDDCLYAVNFIPKEVGVHTVSVKYKDAHIPGSPFQFTVGPLREYGAHRVHAGGPGLERGVVNELCEFNVWTREAGAGSLSLSVEGPSKADIDFKDRKDGSCLVAYKVTEPGEYRVGIKFNDQHIPDSPFKVWVMPQINEAKRVELRALPNENSLKVGSPVTIIINLNGARGVLDAKIISPTGLEDDCFITMIDADEHALRFIPKENGVHTLHIRFNGVHIKESPYRLRVGKDTADPAAVTAFGPGLKDIKSGVKTEFIVDTCSAGHGRLSVSVDGPSKVSMDCTECEEGYKVRYTPLCPGEYYITVKYNGYHIVGSPFRVRCTGDKVIPISEAESASLAVETQDKALGRVGGLPRFKSDAAKVTVRGNGTKKALVGRPTSLTVDGQRAGSNILFAAVYGPKGPCDDVTIKHLGLNVYNVTYNLKDKGDYVLIVKWGDDHIPGSPFKVEATP
ncbi:filamin-A isoform X2 [Tetranychus urticae]|uniref:filamin-A isoform X2 n=1 Tax=Tetranychus urticae TaxID=32264 RepID=UPI00077BD140|nr:filamin-A isoform X2 [Tetranychus urticae]